MLRMRIFSTIKYISITIYKEEHVPEKIDNKIRKNEQRERRIAFGLDPFVAENSSYYCWELCWYDFDFYFLVDKNIKNLRFPPMGG